jgi:acetyl-CoA carboxylase biotin carboxyl carrier protein
MAHMPLDICAHITGTVWKVETQPGQAVEEGQTLVILESMKMEMPIEAPEAGTVTEVLAAPGQAVEEGEVLLRLNPSS